MSEKQTDQISRVHVALVSTDNKWPNDIWNTEDQYAFFLERLIARAVGDREIIHASVAVEGESRSKTDRFSATILTPTLIVSGYVDVPVLEPGVRPPNPENASVAIVPRRFVRAVTLNNVERFGKADDSRPDLVDFSLIIEGQESVRIRIQQSDMNSGSGSRLLDEIIENLDQTVSA